LEMRLLLVVILLGMKLLVMMLASCVVAGTKAVSGDNAVCNEADAGNEAAADGSEDMLIVVAIAFCGSTSATNYSSSGGDVVAVSNSSEVRGS
jgi:hypothetical protein